MQYIKRQFHNLSLNEKVLVGSLVLCFFCTFFTWFEQVSITAIPNMDGNFETSKSFSAYTGIAAIMGWFYSVFVLSAVGLIFFSLSNKQVQKFITNQYWIYLFLTGQSLFLLILTALIYASYSLQFTQAGIQFGLVLAIISNIIAVFTSHFFMLQSKKVERKRNFAEQMHANIHIEPEEVPKEKTHKKEERQEKAGSLQNKQMTFSDYEQ